MDNSVGKGINSMVFAKFYIGARKISFATLANDDFTFVDSLAAKYFDSQTF